MYVVKSLPKKNWEVGVFAWPLCTGNGYIAVMWGMRLCFLACQEFLVCLLQSCGTFEYKHHWLSKPGDMGIYPSKGCHKGWGIYVYTCFSQGDTGNLGETGGKCLQASLLSADNCSQFLDVCHIEGLALRQQLLRNVNRPLSEKY